MPGTGHYGLPYQAKGHEVPPGAVGGDSGCGSQETVSQEISVRALYGRRPCGGTDAGRGGWSTRSSVCTEP